ncbi:MAG: MerR family transcriptional regulator [Armatimonadetes bacterium]|nr:MerR family transcriptional regulator [Armatimonadota bacterium]
MISIAARLCEIHPQTLRMYERLGLVKPRRADSKNRLYSDADIERIRQIQRLTQDLGVNLAGVEVILDLLEKMESMRQEMEDELKRIRQEMRREVESELNQRYALAKKEG